MAEAIEFYCELGLRVVEKSEDLAQLYMGGNRISLKRVDEGSSSLQAGGSAGVRARHIGFRVASRRDVDRTEEILRAQGRQIVLPSHDRPDSRTMFCCDPSGNQIEIYYDCIDEEVSRVQRAGSRAHAT